MSWQHALAGVFIVTGPWAVYALDRLRRHRAQQLSRRDRPRP